MHSGMSSIGSKSTASLKTHRYHFFLFFTGIFIYWAVIPNTMVRLAHEGQVAKLDTKDKKILTLLSENARMPISELAKKVQLGRDTVAYRIKRMQKIDVIRGFYARISLKKLGHNQYYVFFLVDETNPETLPKIINALSEHPNTCSVLEYSDQWDVQWKLAAENINEFDTILTEFLDKYPDAIIERASLLAFDKYNSTQVPYRFPKLKATVANQHNEECKVDHKDLAILTELSKDCRASTYDIAKVVNISPDAVGLRIKKLYGAGIIKQFKTLINLTAIGYSWYTYAVRMKSYSKAHEARFKLFIEDHPNIIKGVKTLGEWDILVYIIAKDQKEFHKTVKELKTLFPRTITRYDTFVAYKEHQFNPFPECMLD